MSQIQTANPLQTAAKPATTNRFAELGTEDFIKIIFTELSHQDPFQPNDSAALLNQLNSIRSIESDNELSKKLTALVSENQLAAASNMLGSYVTGLTQDSTRVAGIAVGVAREGDSISVRLDNGYRVPVSSIDEILGQFVQTPASSAPGTPSTASTATTP